LEGLWIIMEQAEKLSITLPASLARIIREKVKTGAYASNSEVIRDALRAWQEREMEREQHLASVRARLDEAINDPRPPRTPEQVRERLDRLHDKRTKARGGGG
jgi:antitoxin ParD1/3/4